SFGLGTTRQARPFQCNVNVRSSFWDLPTAHTSFFAIASTAKRTSSLTLGLGTMLQFVPFQCMIRGLSSKLASEENPTAQMSLADTTEIACNTLEAPVTLGLGVIFHAVPFQCSTSVLLVLPFAACPTAQTSFGATTATPFRKFQLGLPFGLRTTDQLTPFQRSINVR